MKFETLRDIIDIIDKDIDFEDWSPSGLAERILIEAEKLPERLVFVGVPIVEDDDGGISRIFEINNEDADEDGPFVRVMSWDPDKRHVALKPLDGVKVRVTVELE